MGLVFAANVNISLQGYVHLSLGTLFSYRLRTVLLASIMILIFTYGVNYANYALSCVRRSQEDKNPERNET
jgi:hypothetical protein